MGFWLKFCEASSCTIVYIKHQTMKCIILFELNIVTSLSRPRNKPCGCRGTLHWYLLIGASFPLWQVVTSVFLCVSSTLYRKSAFFMRQDLHSPFLVPSAAEVQSYVQHLPWNGLCELNSKQLWCNQNECMCFCFVYESQIYPRYIFPVPKSIKDIMEDTTLSHLVCISY